ncbi:hypothetical protein OG883_34535 [Streptomyces sp. NBC_01142]|uniref:hypothetical protein n=1 Tax=Streptomyces sp. NBC_01142 TaxID=2975865 RepID=UPI00224ECC90|nr:hypothetical protein [Streptomyces sp. NBC_01142]MCX4824885.1 hypothetical protein [Streptomyces sp. NBC_01142]
MSTNDLQKKDEAALLLARGMTSDKVGEQVGVTGRTVRRWREDPDFEADVRSARTALLGEAVAALGAAAGDAIVVLRSALTDDSVNVRIRAATVLIGALPSFSEHAELDARLTAIETALEKGQAA